jgi:ribosomal protein S27E
MSTRLATRMSLRYLAAALVAGFALSLAPTAPAVADEDPVVRQPRVRVAAPRPAPRVRTVVQTRTVERVRYVPVYYTTGCGGCAPAQPVYRPAYYNTTCGNCAPVAAAPVYYAPRYYAAGCGSCGQSVAVPYQWAVRYARVRHAYFHY